MYNIKKKLINNYTLISIVSYIYLIFKINNNSYKELILYIISFFSYYNYIKNLKYSFIFAFLILLIRELYNIFFINIENYSNEEKEIDNLAKEKESDNETKEIFNKDEKKELTNDKEKKNKLEKNTKKNIKDDIKGSDIKPTI